MNRRIPLCVLPALASLAACEGLFDSTVCTTEVRSAFAVTVVDSVTSQNLAPEALVWVRDGTVVDTLHAASDTYGGAYERPGTYEVVAEHPDYVDWRVTGVRVVEGECHVITEELTARLVPKP